MMIVSISLRRLTGLLVAVILLCTVPSGAYAWGEKGHRIVGHMVVPCLSQRRSVPYGPRSRGLNAPIVFLWLRALYTTRSRDLEHAQTSRLLRLDTRELRDLLIIYA